MTFPINNLPPIFRNAAIEAARISKLPLEMAAMSVIAATGILLRAGVSVAWKHRPERRLYPNILLATGAATGTGKGEMESVTQEPFRLASSAFDADFSEKRGTLMAEKAELIVALKQLEQAHEDCTAPQKDSFFFREYGEKSRRLELVKRVLDGSGPILDTTDSTPEAMVRIMAANRDYAEVIGADSPENWAVLALVSPDGSDLLKWLEPAIEKNGRIESRSPVLLRASQGEAQKPIRVTHFLGRLGFSLAAVSVTVTPSRLRSFFENPSLAEDGLCGRFLFYIYDGKQKLIPPDEKPVNAVVRQSYCTAAMFLFHRFGMATTRTSFLFSDKATKILVEYKNACVRRSWEELSDVSGFTVRWSEIAAKIALILHCMKWGENADRHAEIDAETARQGVEIQAFFAEHLVRILDGKRLDEREKLREKLLLALEKTGRQGGLKPGLAYRFGVGKTPKEGREAVERAVAVGAVEMLYTWHQNREVALAFAPGSGAEKPARREHERVLSERLAKGQTTINSLDSVHRKSEEPGDQGAVELPSLDFSTYPREQTDLPLMDEKSTPVEAPRRTVEVQNNDEIEGPF